jgi:hypothetical protein
MKTLPLILWVSQAVIAQIAIRPIAPEEAAKRPAGPEAEARPGLMAEQPFSVPSSGYVADPSGRGVRPIAGLRVNTFIGDFVDFGEEVAFVASSPNQNYVLEVTASGAASLRLPGSKAFPRIDLPADVTQTSGAALSPNGFAAAIVSSARGLVQIFKTLPNQPTLFAAPTFSELGGAPHAIAISDDGGSLLFAINDGRRDSIYSWRNDGNPPQLAADAESVASIAFGSGSLNAVAADAKSKRVLLLLGNPSGSFTPATLADERTGLAAPVAADFSRDKQKIVVADSVSNTVRLFGLDGTALGSTACDCSPRFLQRLSGNAVFLLTPFDGKSATMFDGDAVPPRTAMVSP